MVSYNFTVNAQAANLRYSPSRSANGSGSGWVLSRSDVGEPSRRTSVAGAKVEMDWIGTAAYIYGSAAPRTYRLSVDGGQAYDGEPDSSLGLLGKFDDLEYGNHTVSMEVLGDQTAVVFTQAILTLQLGEERSDIRRWNQTGTIPENGQSNAVDMNPFFSFTPPGNWNFAERPDPVQGIPNQRVISVNASAAMQFTLQNASAFFVHGASTARRRGMLVTVTPPEEEGPARTRMVNASSPSSPIEFRMLHYYETGLNRDKEYQVEIVNPDLGQENIIDIRYLDVLDAVPLASSDDSQPTPPPPSSTDQAASESALLPGAIAGIAVGVVAFVAIVAGLVFLLMRRRRRKHDDVTVDLFLAGQPSVVHQQDQDGEGSQMRLTIRETDAGSVALPPMYDSSWQFIHGNPGSTASTTEAVPPQSGGVVRGHGTGRRAKRQ